MPAVPKICILGGSGNTGAKLATLLLRHTKVQITLCARNPVRLQQTYDLIYSPDNRDRLHIRVIDAVDENALKAVLNEHDLLVVTAAISNQISDVARLAMDTETDMLDIIYSAKKLDQLTALKAEIETAGRCFITEAGYHPGLPSLLVRWAATRFDTLKSANVFGVIRQDWGALEIGDSTLREFLEELQTLDLSYFRNGSWQTGSYITMKGFRRRPLLDSRGTFWFTPMMFAELKDLPSRIPGLEEVGFFIAGFHWTIDYFIFPLVFAGLKLLPEKFHLALAHFFFRRLKAVSKPPFFTTLKLEAKGIKDGIPGARVLQLSHEDGYWFTAIPVAAAVMQWIDHRDPGLHFMGQYVEPDSLLKQMETFGIHITELKED
ncbi:MAG: NAD(P)H-binding protein [FCB group bacterium]|nr:NAD(P)H-binding protein [FCB group bacterium]